MAQEQDRTFKLISKKHILSFIKILGIEIDLDDVDDSQVEILTDEQISIEPSLYRPDFIARIGNFILMMEYQSTKLKNNENKRFKVYIANFDLKNNNDNQKIIFVVISTTEKSYFTKYCINEWDCFRFPLISLLEYDEKEIISNIKKKIDNQESFNGKDLIELSLTPLMVQGRENIIHQFEINSRLMAILDFPNHEIKESAYGISLLLANMYFEKDDSMRKKIEGDFMMKVDCVQEAIEESKNQGIQQGKEQGQINMIKELLKDKEITPEIAAKHLITINCTPNNIAKITGLNTQQIKKIKHHQ